MHRCGSVERLGTPCRFGYWELLDARPCIFFFKVSATRHPVETQGLVPTASFYISNRIATALSNVARCTIPLISSIPDHVRLGQSPLPMLLINMQITVPSLDQSLTASVEHRTNLQCHQWDWPCYLDSLPALLFKLLALLLLNSGLVLSIKQVCYMYKVRKV